MEIWPCNNSVAGHQIATNFCTWHDSTAVVPCTKFYSDHCIRIEVRVERNFHRIWIAMEKPLVKRGPGPDNCLVQLGNRSLSHYNDVIISEMASQITSISIVCSTVCSFADQGKPQSPASLAFVRGSTGDRWFPLTKGQWRGKCFQSMLSSRESTLRLTSDIIRSPGMS